LVEGQGGGVKGPTFPKRSETLKNQKTKKKKKKKQLTKFKTRKTGNWNRWPKRGPAFAETPAVNVGESRGQ